VPVDGVVAHPGVLTLNVEVEVAGGEGLEVPAEDSLELPVGGDLDGDGGLVLLEGVLGPLDGGGEVLSAGQLGRLAFKSILSNLRAKNRKCFDCGGKNPAWGDIHFGLFVCFDCAGSHRSMGTHISFVRSTTFDQWSEHNLKKMVVGGNARASEYFSKYGLRISKSKSHTEFYDSKVAKRYKQEIEKDAKLLVLGASPKISPNMCGVGSLDALMGDIKDKIPPTVVEKKPTKVSVISKPARVQKEVAEMFNNMVVSTSKKEISKSKKGKINKPVKRKSRKGLNVLAVTKEDAESSDDDFEAEMAAAKTRKKSVTPPPEDNKEEDDFVSGFGPSKKSSQQQSIQSTSAQNVSVEVKTVFENKYGKNVRGGAKKMTSISSEDFLQGDTIQQLHRSQYQNATAIGSESFFGREEKTSTQERGGEYNWEDIRDEAAQKARKLKETANNWFSTLSDKLNR